MGSKRSIQCAKNEGEEKLLVPPGFVSLTSLTLKKMMDNGNNGTDADLMDLGGELKSGLIDAPLSTSVIEKFKKSFNQRPWILHNLDHTPQKHDPKPTDIDMECPLRVSLPKGVIRGCTSCPDCVNVSARWHPEDSHLPILEDAPIFHPTKEEFKDTLKYISKIRSTAENYGICRIIPPPSWEPPCLFKEVETWETSVFTTHVQQIDELENLYLKRKLLRLDDKVENKRSKVISTKECQSHNECATNPDEANCFFMSSNFESGPVFTLQSFKKYADDFKRQYFCLNDEVTDPNLKQIASQKQDKPLIPKLEGEYWRIIENPSEGIEVLYGTNVENRTLVSGFPIKVSQENESRYSEYVESGWNLNNTPKLSGSLLPFGCDSSSAILVPQLFMGMCFASQCWRSEDHHLYSLSYMHLGDPKVWYGIPGRYCFKLVEVVKKLFPQLSKYPPVLHDLVYQISPSMLLSEGIPVYRCVQNPLEFILIFPGAYHSGFHCGFNCLEAVRFAPFDWLPYGLNTVELYSDICRRSSISYDKLLFGAALEAVNAEWKNFAIRNDSLKNQLWKSVRGKEGVLTRALKSRVRLERIRREHLRSLPGSSRPFGEVDAANKRECSICYCDLYLCAICCSCSPNLYSCLHHVKQLCSCSWNDKQVLFRFEIAEMNSLVEALEGNLKAIHVWAKRKSRPVPASYTVKETSGKPGPVDESPRAAAKDLKYPAIREEKTPTIPTSSSLLPIDGHRQNWNLCSDSSKSLPIRSEVTLRSPSILHNVIILDDDDDEDE